MVDRKESILDLAIEINSKGASVHGKDVQSGENVLLFIGSKEAGKSSLISRLQDKDEIPKPTLALDYSYVRRSGKSLVKDVCHIWELGGGIPLSDLISTPIKSTGNLKKFSVVLMLDLSHPHHMWSVLDHFISKSSQLISQYAADMNLAEELTQRTWERLGDMDHHQDKSFIEPYPVPLLIIGGKYDIYQEFDVEDKKLICQTLRSIAHAYGGSLAYYSSKDQVLVKRTKDLLNHLAFGLPSTSKYISQDHQKPLLVPAGADSFQQIDGAPTGGGLTVAMQRWKHNYTSQFPQKEPEDRIIPEDPAKDKNFEEPVIDSLRSQKNEEFETYQWDVARKSQLNYMEG